MRSKEDIPDYKFFPDPDLPPLMIDQAWELLVRSNLVELPDALKERLVKEYGLNKYDAQVLVMELGATKFFEKAAVGRNPKKVSNW